MGQILRYILGYISSPPSKDKISILNANGVIKADIHEIPKHDLSSQRIECKRSNTEICTLDEQSICHLRNEIPHHAGIVKSDVDHPADGCKQGTEQPHLKSQKNWL